MFFGDAVALTGTRVFQTVDDAHANHEAGATARWAAHRWMLLCWPMRTSEASNLCRGGKLGHGFDDCVRSASHVIIIHARPLECLDRFPKAIIGVRITLK